MSSEVKLKVLSGGKIVLAECLGYASELFIPIIVNDRIALQNAVPARRCCGYTKPKKISLPPQTPLAKSTPTKTEQFSCSFRKRSVLRESNTLKFQKEVTIKPVKLEEKSKVSETNPASSFKENQLPSPDIVRRAPVQTVDESIPLPQYEPTKSMKLVQLHITTLPKDTSKILKSKNEKAFNSPKSVFRNLSNVSSFGTPPSLQQTIRNEIELNTLDSGSPNQSFLTRKVNVPGSETKWRKCITPQKTYLRRSANEISYKPTKIQPLQLSKNGKYIDKFYYPNYPCKDRFIIKKRKLVIDRNVKISPKRFKKQITNAEDLKRDKYTDKLPKTRKHFELSHLTAFDLLTNSTFYPKVGRTLNDVFRQGCVNKTAATILKYKQLTKDIPLLEKFN